MDLREEILEQMISRAAELFKKEPGELCESTRFEDDLKAKSVNYAQITTLLESIFDVEIPFMDFRKRKTFGEAAEFVAECIEG